MTTIIELEKEFLLRRAEIDALDQVLETERRGIQFKATLEGRLMNSEERQRRKEISATQCELADALILFGLATLDKLNSSIDVDRLNAEISQINAALGEDLETLKAIEKYAEKATKVASGLAKVAKKLADLIV